MIVARQWDESNSSSSVPDPSSCSSHPGALRLLGAFRSRGHIHARVNPVPFGANASSGEAEGDKSKVPVRTDIYRGAGSSKIGKPQNQAENFFGKLLTTVFFSAKNPLNLKGVKNVRQFFLDHRLQSVVH